LDKVELLNNLKPEEKLLLAEALQDFVFVKDEKFFEEGEAGVMFYILIEGEVSVRKKGKEVNKVKATEDNAPFFGEMALLNNQPRAATVTVVSETAKCSAVDKVSFDMLLGTLEDLKQRGKNGDAAVAKVKPGKTAGNRFGKIKRSDLKRLGLLGCGGFGAVEMVEHTVTKEYYALKALSKGYICKSGMQQSVISEKDVQLMCDSPFIIKLYETYNGEQSLYLLLELAQGGELYATYNKKGLWGNDKCARFYVAGTVLAFDHLHGMKIIFRDLKPENLLLNEKGHVKLTDMGLAKVCIGKSFTTCGTPDYFAPEVLSSKGHNQAVDWWCLGILIFELLSGHPPFESPSPMQIYAKIGKGISQVRFPRQCQGPQEKLIRELLDPNPGMRLAMRKGGSQNIKSHKWYEEKAFSWKDFEQLKMDPPYKPPVKSNTDMSNFHARKDDMPPQIPYKDPKTGWDKDFATST